MITFDDELTWLIEHMFTSMYAATGVGLAANQTGVPHRVFVYDCHDAAGSIPSGTSSTPSSLRHRLSPSRSPTRRAASRCPGPYADLSQPGIATVTGVDRTGEPLTVSGTGVLARCLQHETDHLNRIVYLDHVSPQRRAAVCGPPGRPRGPTEE